jgi:hypothetical protein
MIHPERGHCSTDDGHQRHRLAWLCSGANEPAPSADDIIDGYNQLVALAHLHGMRIIGATLTPF